MTGAEQARSFDDEASPCVCPRPVVDLLALAVKCAEASLGSKYPDAVIGADYVKTFMEQPAEAWCGFIALPPDEVQS